jgi:hypothetical protein
MSSAGQARPHPDNENSESDDEVSRTLEPRTVTRIIENPIIEQHLLNEKAKNVSVGFDCCVLLLTML